MLYCLASLVYFRYMFNEEIKKLLFQVISSWQVLAVTVVLVLYVFLVNYVARIYHRPRNTRKPFLPMPKSDSSSAQIPLASPSESEELGLEDEAQPSKSK